MTVLDCLLDWLCLDVALCVCVFDVKCVLIIHARRNWNEIIIIIKNKRIISILHFPSFERKKQSIRRPLCFIAVLYPFVQPIKQNGFSNIFHSQFWICLFLIFLMFFINWFLWSHNWKKTTNFSFVSKNNNRKKNSIFKCQEFQPKKRNEISDSFRMFQLLIFFFAFVRFFLIAFDGRIITTMFADDDNHGRRSYFSGINTIWRASLMSFAFARFFFFLLLPKTLRHTRFCLVNQKVWSPFCGRASVF